MLGQACWRGEADWSAEDCVTGLPKEYFHWNVKSFLTKGRVDGRYVLCSRKSSEGRTIAGRASLARGGCWGYTVAKAQEFPEARVNR